MINLLLCFIMYFFCLFVFHSLRTTRNLHSHLHEAPLTKKHFQVTGYGIVSTTQQERKRDTFSNGILEQDWQPQNYSVTS